MQRIQIDHCREECIVGTILLQKSQDVIPHRLISSPAASMNDSLLAAMSDQDWFRQVDTYSCQVGFQHLIGESLFGLTFSE